MEPNDLPSFSYTGKYHLCRYAIGKILRILNLRQEHAKSNLKTKEKTN